MKARYHITQFEGFEIEPCRVENKDSGHVNVCDPDRAEFWTVYGRIQSGEILEAVALFDCLDRIDAERALSLLKTSIYEIKRYKRNLLAIDNTKGL